MIYETLSCVADEMNDYFKQKLKIAEDKVVIGSIINQDGTVAVQGENKIVITLINVEKEPAMNTPSASSGGRIIKGAAAPASINLYLLFSAYFSAINYPEALRFLSYTISFLQERSAFNRSNTMRLPDALEKLTFEMESMGFDRLNNIWASLGAKYMPSAVYKVRMLTFDTSLMREYRPVISKI